MKNLYPIHLKRLSLLFFLFFYTFCSWGQTATTRITVITHGFSLNGKLDEGWEKFALRIRKKTGGTVFFNGSDGKWYILRNIKDGNETLVNGTDEPNEHKIFLFNWAKLSNNFQDGNLESSSNSLFAMLCNSPIGNVFEGYYHTHFIGHSRGNILLLQVAYRVLKYFPAKVINHFTFLDPHPATPMNDVSISEEKYSLPCVYGTPSSWGAGVIGSPLAFDTKLKVPSNVLKADEYFRLDGVYEENSINLETMGFFDFDGVPVFGLGGYGRKLNNTALKSSTFSLAHSNVWEWYLSTIDTSIPLKKSSWFDTETINGNTYLKVSENPRFYETEFFTGYYYSNEGGGYSQLPTISSSDKVSLSEMEARTKSRDNITLSSIFNRTFKYPDGLLYPNNHLGWSNFGGASKKSSIANGKVRIKNGGEICSSISYFPPESSKIKVYARKADDNLYSVAINFNLKKSNGSSIYKLPSTQTLFSSNIEEFTFNIPSSLKGQSGFIYFSANGTIEIDSISLINTNNQNLRLNETTADIDLTSSSYFDFPIEYEVTPSTLIKGQSPLSFKATITNTMPQFWSGTLKMYWRKVSDEGKGVLLKSQAVNLAPGAGVILDRGTDFIISEPGDYILGIYANYDEIPMDGYIFSVEEQQTDEVSTPTVSVSPSESTHTFGSVVIGSTDGQTFTIQNTSNTNVTISGVSITGTGFSQGTSTCCGTLAPNQSYTIKVNTSPTDATVYTGQLQISGNFTGSPITVALTTQGVYNTPPITGCLSASIAAVNIQSGNTDALKQQYFGLTNNSLTGSVNITNVSFTGADASYFSYDNNLFTLPSSIAPAQTTGFLVKFNNPQNTNRTYNANLVFTTNNPSCPSLTIPVSATHTPSTLTWLAPLTDETIVAAVSPIEAIHLKWQGTLPVEGGAVDIQYTIDGGITWTPIYSWQSCTIGHTNTGINIASMNLPNETFAGKDIQFRIKPCYDSITPWKYSAIAHIVAPNQQTLQVLYPNGYEIFNGGQNIKIKWANYIGYKSVNISLTITDQYGNPLTISIANNVSGQATEYNWTVPTGIHSEYAKINITSANISDLSDNVFFIQTTPNPPFVISNISVRPEGCKSTPEGNLSLNITGGTPPYSTSIKKVGDYETYIPNGTLTAGDYICIVMDNNFRRTSFNFTVPKLQDFTHSIQVVNDTCSGSKGKINVNLGNTFQYLGTGGSIYNATFKRNGTQIYSGQNTSLVNQPSGFYEITIKDAQQCGFTENIYLDSSPGTYFNVTPTITNTSCAGATGAISLNTGVAQSPTFAWSNGATTPNISTISAGTYSVNISDASGCIQRKSFDVVEQGGWSETPTNYYATRDTKIDGTKVYSNDMFTHQINIVDATNNSYDFIKLLKYYSTTDYVDAYRIDAQNGYLYIVYNDYKPNIGSETHFLKINSATKQILNRLIVTNSSYDYNKISFIDGQLYCLRNTNNALDIVNFTANSFVTKPITGQCLDFSLDANSNKLYFCGFDTNNSPEIFVYDIASSSFNSNTYSVPYNAFRIIVNGSYAYLTGSASSGTYIQRFNLSSLSYTDNVIINSQAPNPSGLVLKNPQTLFASYSGTGNNYIEVVDIGLFQKIDRITTQSYFNSIAYSPTNDALYGITRINNNNIISKIISNKFDFSYAKTDATCGQSNGSITLTIPNDGKIYTYLWSNGATTKDINNLSAGNYTITVSQQGGCSVKKTIQILQNSSAITPPVGIPSNRCGTGSITLGATGCSGTYNWYSASTGGASLNASSSYTTPSISSTTNYYVDCTIGSCISTRTMATATINMIPPVPSISSITINSGQTATLAASGCTGSILWFATSTGGSTLATGSTYTTPILTTTTTYYASCIIDGCESNTRRSGVVNVSACTPPITPSLESITINRATAITTDVSITCVNGIVKWYDSHTNGNLIFTGSSYTTPILYTSTNYYVSCTINSCESLRGTWQIIYNSDPCYSSLNWGNTNLSGNHQTSGTFSSSSTILGSPYRTNFFSAKSITLTPGFKTSTGTVFRAEIQNCITNDGLIAYYPFNGNTYDESGNLNHGIVNGATLTTDRFGIANKAYSFNGISNDISINKIFGPYSEVTISAWVFINSSTPDFQAIVSPNNLEFVHFQANTTGATGAYVLNPATVVSFPSIPFTPLAKWRHLVIKIVSGNSKIYENGIPVSNSNQTFTSITPTTLLKLGSGYQNSRFLNGKLDDIRIYNRALSDTEVLQLYNAEK